MAELTITSAGTEGKAIFAAGHATVSVEAFWSQGAEEVQIRIVLGGYGEDGPVGEWDGDRLRWLREPTVRPVERTLKWCDAAIAKTWPPGSKVITRWMSDGRWQYEADNDHQPDWVNEKLLIWETIQWAMLEGADDARG